MKWRTAAFLLLCGRGLHIPSKFDTLDAMRL